MADLYLLSLALSLTIGVASTVALVALSRTERFFALFHVRGVTERPRWGGAVFLITFAATPYIASALSGEASEIFSPRSGEFLGLLAAVSLVFLVGFLDDVRLTSPYLRSFVFFLAGAAVYAAGYRIDDIGLPWGMVLDFGPYGGFFVTVLWVYATINAFNWLDGNDGVAAGVGIFACVTMAVVAGNSHHPTVALLLVVMTGAMLGFLPFNLPPASAYVGDSGAYVLGFVLGALSIRGAEGPTEQWFVAVPLIALGYPILDLTLATVRRILAQTHPMRGDADHIHHRLIAHGAGPRGLLVIIYSYAALFSIGAILVHYVDATWLEAAVVLTLLTVIGVTLARLGYVLTLWNSRSVVWLRQRFFAPEPADVSE